MDSANGRKKRTSYPSRLVDSNVGPNLLNAPPQISPEAPDAVADFLADPQKRDAESLGSPGTSPVEQKRQRTQTSDELREDAQRRLMDAINIEAQKIHGENANVFPDHVLPLSSGSANSAPTPTPQRRGRGRPRKVQPAAGPPVPPLLAIPQLPLSGIASLTPGGDQHQQKPPAIADSLSHESVPHPPEQHPGPPIPTLGGVPQYPLPGFAPSSFSGYKQQQYLPATSASGTDRLPFPQAQIYKGLPATVSSGVPQPQPHFAISVSQLQAQAVIATKALRGVSQGQSQVNDGVPASVGGIIPYPHQGFAPAAHQSHPQQAPSAIAAPVPSSGHNRRQATRPDIGTPAAASRRAPRKANSSVNGGASPSRNAGVNTQQPARPTPDPRTSTASLPPVQQVAQPVFGAEIGRIGRVQPPQAPYFAQDWTNNPNDLANTPQPNTNSSSGTANPVIVDPMEFLAITDGANKAWAAHGIAVPSLSQSPFPPPKDSEDIRHAGGRKFHSWVPGKVVYLSAAFNEGADPAIGTMIHFPIDWDLAFYHSRRLAWFYSENTGNSPTAVFPIKIAFATTGHWMFKQTIYPLPLFGQTPLFPDQPIPDDQTLLVDLWICASDLQIPKLQNLALNELDRIRNETGHMNIQALIHVYAHTEVGSLLRQYMVWQYANRLSEFAIPQALDYYPKAFMMDWIIMLTQMCKSKTGMNDFPVNLVVGDFMVREMRVEWPFGEVEMEMGSEQILR
ncbi:hypothetical protein BKA61DRAFT_695338 [Leptodontidium sp. MPI-SDFR-AT-0119]|nr:hypothetical protein BKA61DRAFT_695338 [Leptodontidium sp. MPI-SDFR-AT-0119]